MNKRTIIETFSTSIYELPSACKEELYSNAILKQVAKKEIIVHQDQISNKMYFVSQGAMRAYYLKEGKDITDWFAFENEFICAIQSYFNEIPSPHFIEAIEPSILLEISKESIAYLSEKYRAFERLGTISTTQTMLHLQERIVSLQFETAHQKYINLLQKRPNIELRVPLIHIASYLGISLETLSRIRAKRLKT